MFASFRGVFRAFRGVFGFRVREAGGVWFAGAHPGRTTGCDAAGVTCRSRGAFCDGPGGEPPWRDRRTKIQARIHRRSGHPMNGRRSTPLRSLPRAPPGLPRSQAPRSPQDTQERFGRGLVGIFLRRRRSGPLHGSGRLRGAGRIREAVGRKRGSSRRSHGSPAARARARTPRAGSGHAKAPASEEVGGF